MPVGEVSPSSTTKVATGMFDGFANEVNLPQNFQNLFEDAEVSLFLNIYVAAVSGSSESKMSNLAFI